MSRSSNEKVKILSPECPLAQVAREAITAEARMEGNQKAQKAILGVVEG